MDFTYTITDINLLTQTFSARYVPVDETLGGVTVASIWITPDIADGFVDGTVDEIVFNEELNQKALKASEDVQQQWARLEKVRTADKETTQMVGAESGTIAGSVIPETSQGYLQRLAAEKNKEIVEDFRVAAAQIKAGYDEDEVLSWDKQIQEATAYQADPTAPTPLLDGILSERTSDDKVSLTASILQKADDYAIALGPHMGRKQQRSKNLDAIDLNASDAEDQIEAI